jgi:hypothetical protein
MVVWVLGTMVQIQASSSEKEFSVNDLESHQILRIRFTPEKPVFNELETIDAMATLGSRDSKPIIIPISSEFFHKKTAPAAFILYNQKVMPDGLTDPLEMTAPKYIFNDVCFVEETIKLVLYIIVLWRVRALAFTLKPKTLRDLYNLKGVSISTLILRWVNLRMMILHLFLKI